MRLLAFFLTALSAAFSQSVTNPTSPTSNPNQISVTNSYLYLNKMHFAGTWSGTVTYNSQDVVIYSGSTYVSLQTANLSIAPSGNPLWWTQLGGSGSGGGTWGSITGTLSAQTDLAAALCTGVTGGVLYYNGSGCANLPSFQYVAANNYYWLGPTTINGPNPQEEFLFVGRNSADTSGVGNEEAINGDIVFTGAANSTIDFRGLRGASSTTTTSTGNLTKSGVGNGGGMVGVGGLIQAQGSGTVSQASGVTGFIQVGLTIPSTLTDGAAFRATRPAVQAGSTLTTYSAYRSMGSASVTGGSTLPTIFGLRVDPLLSGTDQCAALTGAWGACINDPSLFGTTTFASTLTASALGLGLAHLSSAGVFSSSAVNLASADVTGLLPNANLANPSITVSGTTCTLGGSCSPSGGGGTAILGAIVTNGAGSYVAASSTGYERLMGQLGSGGMGTAETYGAGVNVQFPIERTGTAQHLCVTISPYTNQPASGTMVVTLRVNAANTALTFTIPVSSSGTYCDLTHTVAISAGNLIDVQFVNNATAQSGSAINTYLEIQ